MLVIKSYSQDRKSGHLIETVPRFVSRFFTNTY